MRDRDRAWGSEAGGGGGVGGGEESKEMVRVKGMYRYGSGLEAQTLFMV